MNNLQAFFTADYLLAVPTVSKYEIYFLYISLAIIVITLGLKIYFNFSKRSKAFKSIDKVWFWGYVTIGLLGLLVWFSRNQQLPMLGTRLASYIWLSTILIYGLFALYYYKKNVNKSISSHYEKTRKDKYLKR